uniref:Uncharacterized protein n=1 Tax=Anopheles culicifacies TaxID=139723 RepID=A0A182M003_9DIPT
MGELADRFIFVLTNQTLTNFLYGELCLQMATLCLVAAYGQCLTARSRYNHIKLACRMANGVDRKRICFTNFHDLHHGRIKHVDCTGRDEVARLLIDVPHDILANLGCLKLRRLAGKRERDELVLWIEYFNGLIFGH